MSKSSFIRHTRVERLKLNRRYSIVSIIDLWAMIETTGCEWLSQLGDTDAAYHVECAVIGNEWVRLKA